jgi:hypothetical protein
MNIPPIQPTGQPSELPGGSPLRDRVRNALTSLRQGTDALQGALAAPDNPVQISHLFEQLQQPIQTLVQLANRQPPVMSQNEIDVVKDLTMQLELTQMDVQEVSPTAIAAIQGSSTTLFHLFAAEAAGIPEPNTASLQAVNYLSSLSDTLQLHLKIKSKDVSHIAADMQAPVKELEQLSSLGILNVPQSDLVSELTITYNTQIKIPDRATPETLSQFQKNLQTLTHLLTI